MGPKAKLESSSRRRRLLPAQGQRQRQRQRCASIPIRRGHGESEDQRVVLRMQTQHLQLVRRRYGLSYDTNETALKEAFSQYGDVIAVKVVCHPTTGKSKGFGFVNFSSQNQAAVALQSMNGQLLDGRNIRVHYAIGTGRSAATDD